MKASVGPGGTGGGGDPGRPVAASPPLAGIDAIAWHRFTNPSWAGEIPRGLRDLAGPGPTADRAEALRLLGRVFRTPAHLALEPARAALPFVVRLALRPGLADRAALLDLLADVAASHFPAGSIARPADHPDCCAAITDAHDELVATLEDPDPEVRIAAVNLLWRYAAWAPCGGQALAALQRLDQTEADVAVRIRLRMDGATAAEAMPTAGQQCAPAHEALCDAVAAFLEPCDTDRDAPALELARLWGRGRRAVSATEGSGIVWPALLAAALSPATPRHAYPLWAAGGSGLADYLVEPYLPPRGRAAVPRSEPRPGAVEAVTGIVAGLLARPEAAVRRGALQAAGTAITRLRGSVPPLIPVIVAALDDPDPTVRDRSADLLGALAAAGTPRTGPTPAHVDRLAEMLKDPDPDLAAQAATALAAFGDARALPFVLRALGELRPGRTPQRRERAEPLAQQHPQPPPPPNTIEPWDTQHYYFREPDVLGYGVPGLADAYTDQLVPSLRGALAACLAPKAAEPGVPEPDTEEHQIRALARALACCGPPASAATPELEAALRRLEQRGSPTGSVHDALAAAGPGAHSAVRALAEITGLGLAHFRTALHAPPTTLWAQTGYLAAPWRIDPLATALQAAATRFAIDADSSAYLASLDDAAAVLTELRRLRADATGPGRPGGTPSRTQRQSLDGRVKDCARLAALAAGYGRLGPQAGAGRVAPLLHHLEGADRPRWNNADLWIAWAHWRTTGETRVALPAYIDALRSTDFSPSGDRQLPALRLFAGLTPAANHPLAADLAASLRALTEGETRIEFNGDGARGRIAQDQELRHRASKALAALSGTASA